MTSNPKLTIGMPVYNGELFIKKAIESILAQTFTDFELIISNNSSTDSTEKICQDFLNKDNRIQIHTQEKNIGIHRNFNFLLSPLCVNLLSTITKKSTYLLRIFNLRSSTRSSSKYIKQSNIFIITF